MSEYVIFCLADKTVYSLHRDIFVTNSTKAFVFHDYDIAEIIKESWIEGFAREFREDMRSEFMILKLEPDTLEIRYDD